MLGAALRGDQQEEADAGQADQHRDHVAVETLSEPSHDCRDYPFRGAPPATGRRDRSGGRETGAERPGDRRAGDGSPGERETGRSVTNRPEAVDGAGHHPRLLGKKGDNYDRCSNP
ncbi:hypothetical protein GCM10017673_35370 [Streptosporangium violaceochromogenes]|nr:hypothetical protein GCM10017673_35370 [Streptosporangium violaceochromogenes]